MRSLIYFTALILVSGLLISGCTIDENDTDITDAREKFTGNWTVSETCNRSAYSVTIEKDPDFADRVIIRNFWLIGYNEKPPYAIIDGNGISIPKQFMCDNDSNEVEGSGFIEDNKITWSYQINDGADLHFCSATYSR